MYFPITTKQPGTARFALEIPVIEKRRAGLDADLRLWIILDVFNNDIVGRSVYLEPESPLGRLSKAFFRPLLCEFVARRKLLTEISRSKLRPVNTWHQRGGSGRTRTGVVRSARRALNLA